MSSPVSPADGFSVTFEATPLPEHRSKWRVIGAWRDPVHDAAQRHINLRTIASVLMTQEGVTGITILQDMTLWLEEMMYSQAPSSDEYTDSDKLLAALQHFSEYLECAYFQGELTV